MRADMRTKAGRKSASESVFLESDRSKPLTRIFRNVFYRSWRRRHQRNLRRRFDKFSDNLLRRPSRPLYTDVVLAKTSMPLPSVQLIIGIGFGIRCYLGILSRFKFSNRFEAIPDLRVPSLNLLGGRANRSVGRRTELYLSHAASGYLLNS